jgi:hypothetical protein
MNLRTDCVANATMIDINSVHMAASCRPEHIAMIEMPATAATTPLLHIVLILVHDYRNQTTGAINMSKQGQEP